MFNSTEEKSHQLPYSGADPLCETPCRSVRLHRLVFSSCFSPFVTHLFKSIYCRYAGATDEKDQKHHRIKYRASVSSRH